MGREFKYLYSFLVLVLFLFLFLTWCLLCCLVICFCFLLFSYVFGSGLVSSADGLVTISSQSPLPLTPANLLP